MRRNDHGSMGFRSLSGAAFLAITLGAALLGNSQPFPGPALESSPTTRSQPGSPSLEVVSHVGGQPQGIAIQGNVAYLAVGPRIVVVDVSDPTAPVVAGSTLPSDDPIGSIQIHGRRLYAVAGGMLRIFDISRALDPVLLGATFVGSPVGMTIVDEAIYLAGGSEFRIISVVDPANPRQVASVPPTDTRIRFLGAPQVVGGYAYLYSGDRDRDNAYEIWEITSPERPRKIGALALDGQSMGLSFDRGHAYLGSAEGLRILELSDPANPTDVGFLPTPSADLPGRDRPAEMNPDGTIRIDAVRVAWDTLGPTLRASKYYHGELQGFILYDLSDPAVPVARGAYELPERQEKLETMAIDGSRAFAAYETELVIYDMSEPGPLRMAGSYSFPSSMYRVALWGETLLALGRFGLHVYDVREPAQPVETGFYRTPSEPFAMATDGQYAYIMVGRSRRESYNAGVIGPNDGMHIVDISDPSRPTQVGFAPAANDVLSVAVAGNHVYVGFEFSGLVIFDVSDPTRPREMPYRTTERRYRIVDIQPHGSLLYIVTYEALRVMDISEAASPTEISRLPGISLDAVALGDGYAYLAGGSGGGGGFTVVSVADPASPRQVAEVQMGAHGVAVSRGRAYVGAGSRGLWVADISDPTVPRPVGVIQAGIGGLRVESIAILGEHLFAAGGTNGLYIVRVVEPGR